MIFLTGFISSSLLRCLHHFILGGGLTFTSTHTHTHTHTHTVSVKKNIPEVRLTSADKKQANLPAVRQSRLPIARTGGADVQHDSFTTWAIGIANRLRLVMQSRNGERSEFCYRQARFSWGSSRHLFNGHLGVKWPVFESDDLHLVARLKNALNYFRSPRLRWAHRENFSFAFTFAFRYRVARVFTPHEFAQSPRGIPRLSQTLKTSKIGGKAGLR